MALDVVLVGGGLANSLIAYRLRAHFPELRILLLEQGPALGGNHTWSFHSTDVSAGQLAWLAPFRAQSWNHYDVRFPRLERRLSGGYHTITSARLHQIIVDALGTDVKLNVRITRINQRWVELEDGSRWEATVVIDGRGDPGGDALVVRYQKFLGQVLRLAAGHGLGGPLLMDATVEQREGFRFMYTLPMAADRLLVEDTRYSNTPTLSRAEMRDAIADYAGRQGWRVTAMLGEEEGVLPVVLAGDIRAFWAADPGVPRSGVRAGLFHYTTSYSLAEAVRLADCIARVWPMDSGEIYAYIRQRSLDLWRRGRFFRLLNRMLFLAAEDAERYRVLQHFYRLPEDLIHRFYAGRTTLADKLRILSGRPPVPVSRALRSAFGELRTQAGIND